MVINDDILSSMEMTDDLLIMIALAATAVVLVMTCCSTKKTSGAGHPSFRTILDKYFSLEQVQEALTAAGMEGSELIVGVDFTKSNEWTGKQSNGGRSLHDGSSNSTPYSRALSAVATTLEAFDDDNLIPSYGFGDSTTKGQSVFAFNSGDRPCEGLGDLLQRYGELCASSALCLSGPTDFAPLIWRAIEIVRASGNNFHILLIVADGQVTAERRTIDAIIEASHYPLSIVVVGVGDGPFDQMREFDDRLPQRKFDNFQFVDMTALEREVSRRHGRAAWNDSNSSNNSLSSFDAAFAMQCLMEVPEQLREMKRLGLIGEPTARRLPERVTVKAPPDGRGGESARRHNQRNSNNREETPGSDVAPTTTSSAASELPEEFFCSITQEVMKDPVFCSDGHTYERAAIAEWFRSNDTSPLTNARLASKDLVRNHALASQIDRAQLSY